MSTMTRLTEEEIRGIVESGQHATKLFRDDLLVLLDELTALRAALRERDERWIPVTERLPDELRICVCCITSDGQPWVCDCFFDSGRFTTMPEGWRVTHWKPLPELPEEMQSLRAPKENP